MWKKNLIKTGHDYVHCGIAATHRRLKLEAWWSGYSCDVDEYVQKYPKCREIKTKLSPKEDSFMAQRKTAMDSRLYESHAC